jgi:hypothetical protein
MTTYNAKTLFTGYKLGLKTADLYVGVPSKFIKNGEIKVKYKQLSKVYKTEQKKTERTFANKFRPGAEYTLYYYLWNKAKVYETKDQM